MTKFNSILPILLLLTGCEKVIDVHLNDASPVIVIEGTLSDNPNLAHVKISKTNSYFSTDPAEEVSGATAIITDNEGREFILDEKDGEYTNKTIFPHIDQVYTLSVIVDGTVYESVSQMHKVVFIDSLSVVLNEEYSVFKDAYNVNLYFHDPPEENNYYRLRTFLNGELEDTPEDFIFFDDSNTNGKFIELRIRRKVFEVGDTVSYELQTIDRAAYEYFDALSELIDDNSAGNASPANPNPNFTNSALGYFSAYSSDAKTIVIRTKIKSIR